MTAVHESPLKFGLIYTGSDDGLVHVSKDGGVTWTNISTGLPEDLWMSRIQASQHEPGRVYVSLNGYRWDDFRSFVYVSEDYGATWNRLGLDLPFEPVNVVKEDSKNPNLLYVGTDHALYVSLDRGKSFMLMNKELPAAPVHDLVVHPRENELLVGTHGRSLYLAPVQHLQQLVDSVLEKTLFAFEVKKVRFSNNWGGSTYAWAEEIPEPDIELPVFVKAGGKLKITVKSDDLTLKTWETDVTKGLNYPVYHGEIEEAIVPAFEKQLNKKKKPEDKEIKIKKAKNGKFYLRKGTYTIAFEKDGKKLEQKLVVE